MSKAMKVALSFTVIGFFGSLPVGVLTGVSGFLAMFTGSAAALACFIVLCIWA